MGGGGGRGGGNDDYNKSIIKRNASMICSNI